jgi:hypothetical protein
MAKIYISGRTAGFMGGQWRTLLQKILYLVPTRCKNRRMVGKVLTENRWVMISQVATTGKQAYSVSTYALQLEESLGIP